MHALAGEAGVGQQQRGPVAAVGERRRRPRGPGRSWLSRPRSPPATRRAEGADGVGPVARRPLVGAEVGHPPRRCRGRSARRPARRVPPVRLGGQPPGQLVGLGARGREEDGVEPRRHRRHQPLGELDDLRVEVARVGVEPPELPADALDDGRVGVPDDGDVVVGVEVAAAVGREEPRALTADDLQRLVVEERRDRAAHRVARGAEQGAGVAGRRRRVPARRCSRCASSVGDSCSSSRRRTRVGVVVLRDVRRVVGVGHRAAARR